MFDWAQEKKDKYYAKAQKLINKAGLREECRVDRDRFGVVRNETVKIYIILEKDIKLPSIRKLRKLPEYHPIYDRTMSKQLPKMTFKPTTESGYIELKLQRKDR